MTEKVLNGCNIKWLRFLLSLF